MKLHPENAKRLALLCGNINENIKEIERFFSISIKNRGHNFIIKGDEEKIIQAQLTLEQLYQNTIDIEHIDIDEIRLLMCEINKSSQEKSISKKYASIIGKSLNVTAKTYNQEQYISNIKNHEVNFAIGPSGTGKTFLAAAYAINELMNNNVKRLILVRPAVEAGEKLGFLPGDLNQKVDPYLKPLLDSLAYLISAEKINYYIEKNIIEIAPLAYMRGRTLKDSFIILDEAQNTTKEQMKMFLTRIGFGSKTIVTGDISQIDLPKHELSGLKHVINILSDVDEISFTYLKPQDIIRHPIVEKIVSAYEKHE